MNEYKELAAQIRKCLDGTISFVDLKLFLESFVFDGRQNEPRLTNKILSFIKSCDENTLFELSESVLEEPEVIEEEFLRQVALLTLRKRLDQAAGARLIVDFYKKRSKSQLDDPDLEDFVHIAEWLVCDSDNEFVEISADDTFIESCRKIYPKLNARLFLAK